jgi:NAD(P)-dependent dehydrogenase (short-subunit alcohol dehydrogenase family)/acyl dehydratase
MTALRFDGRVAIVTGAGGGLGRQHALTLASLGAKVVVNDLGGRADGQGQSSRAADFVVAEIRDAGGEAVADYHSVEQGEAIVQTALDAFGTVDIVINNAGILRDVSFVKMTEQDWELVLKVHLNGSKSVSHAAWPIMRAKGYGRIVMTTSAAGIYGNFGQANYCAAKLGILGLANCLAEEGRSKNILVNTIAPLAASRLTETVMPADLLELLKPEAVSPLVAWLCHEDCNETKGLFEVGAGYIGKLRWQRSAGHHFHPNRPFDIDQVAKNWQKMTDFSEPYYPTTTTESIMPIIEQANQPRLGGNEFIDLDLASRSESELVLESSYNEHDLALYALGVGAARNPLDESELKYVYELNGEFCALPTYAVMPQMNAMLECAKSGQNALPGMNFGFERLLHGEQYTEIKKPLPRQATLKHSFKLKSAYDKDPHAVVTFAISSTDETGEEVAYNEMTAFVKGAGGWGGDRGASGEINLPPDREPDAIIEEQTDAHQTLIYRLSGDWNPLHADPQFARAFGYDKPILHGLCTYGYCGRHVIKAFANNDSRYFKSIKARFAQSVYPGETLVTKMWKIDDEQIVFETSVKERQKVVIKNACVMLHRELSQLKQSTTSSNAASASDVATPPTSQAAQIFAVIDQQILSNPVWVDKTKTVFQFHLKNPSSDWFIDLKNGTGQATMGVAPHPDVTIELDDGLIATVVTATLPEVQKLYFGGQLKISGNIMASNKLTILQAIDPHLYQPAPVVADTPATAEQTVPVVVKQGQAGSYLERLCQLSVSQRIDSPIQIVWQVHDPDQTWHTRLSDQYLVMQSDAMRADLTLSISDDDLVTWLSGGRTTQALYQHGQLRIDGDIKQIKVLDQFIQQFIQQHAGSAA